MSSHEAVYTHNKETDTMEQLPVAREDFTLPNIRSILTVDVLKLKLLIVFRYLVKKILDRLN